MPSSHPFGSEIDAEALRALFDACSSWEERYRQLILLAKKLPPLPESLKQQHLELKGCENRVWLGHRLNENGMLHFYGDSDGRIVKGILAVLLVQIEGKTPRQILALDLMRLFHELGLYGQLSASRSQGLDALVGAIKNAAQSYV
ncbi:cysteine desulfurase, sulfur acceptor subunit CsdE [Leminorella grimontii]|uniref:Cysteine desulfurase, sulfur acceptor subunit CsdE n=1 Tax=Leminorella grimontii TaxID=82981 RepID=A0AAV5MZS7_9GAMM|nr:cysteine desulfurase sulfur acceptor subunit CsdE [Leminorella grimontii]KFC97286.1 cysteine desulfurase sulfur acceptor protein [Leminorella grimontii ATCC 33999 = DSM 5078]GKX55361.1 cysteine desulfurase, sulfur acceptor subunit CsdE [Leminorella grimontii]VFS56464.1 Uncharacterized sufE-like protein ygdK [Leminorella grimontii]